MKLSVQIVQNEQGDFTALCPTLPGCMCRGDTREEVCDKLDEVIRGYRRELAATTQSRDAVRFLVFAPLPIVARAPYGVLLAAATGLLPGWSRRLLRLPIPPLADPLLIRPAATALVRTLGWALAPER